MHSRFYCLQCCTISASFTNTQQQYADSKIILALFFLHLINENKDYRVTNNPTEVCHLGVVVGLTHR